MTKKHLIIIATVLLVLIAAIAQARTLNLPVRSGKLITLPVPAKTVMIADPSIADLQLPSPNTIFLFANKAGSTTVYALDEHGKTITKVELTTGHNIKEFLATVKQELPHADISARTLREKLYVSGTVETPVQADTVMSIAGSFEPDSKNLVNQLGITMPTQVNIKVRFAEVSRNATEKLGLNWESLGSLQATTKLTGVFNSTFSNWSGDNFNFDFNISKDVIFNALSGDGLVTTLAEPNLTVVTGKKATFNVGGSVPVSVPVAASQASQVEYKNFGVMLDVEPTILSNGRISLYVKPEVSRIAGSTEKTGNFIFSKNTAETYVELADGQSFVLAGLFENREDNAINRFPFLGDVPVLGALFRSTQYQKKETELVIICTVNLVKPGLEKDFVLPTDGILAAPPLERLLMGDRYAKRPAIAPKAGEQHVEKPLPVPVRPLEGQAGFYF